MKKNLSAIARIMALLVIAAMLLPAFAACSKSPENALVGKWNAELDLSGYMRKQAADESLSQMGIDPSAFDFSGLTLKISYEFDKDGNYKAEADEESAKNLMKNLGKAMADMFKAAMGDLLSEEMLLAALGISSWDEFGEAMMKDEDGDEIDLGGLTGSGKYTVEGNKLTMTEDDGVKQTAEFSVNGSELKFTTFESSGMEEKDNEIMKELLPIVFKKN